MTSPIDFRVPVKDLRDAANNSDRKKILEKIQCDAQKIKDLFNKNLEAQSAGKKAEIRTGCWGSCTLGCTVPSPSQSFARTSRTDSSDDETKSDSCASDVTDRVDSEDR